MAMRERIRKTRVGQRLARASVGKMLLSEDVPLTNSRHQLTAVTLLLLRGYFR